MEYEAVIGLEVHVQIQTKTKMFASAPYSYGREPNTCLDPVVMALPGALPVLNFEAIKDTIKVGMMLGCTIPEVFTWDRKNYFYPDSPKNYQLTQNVNPVCWGGQVEIELAGANRAEMGKHRFVKMNRIHLEEDVGKLTHFANDSLIDFNRAGVALMEIVSEPDMYSSDEAFAYLTSLRQTISQLGVSECDMEKGQMRCDVNVSIRPKGETKLGVRTELKNLNSITGAKNAIDYEIRRQKSVLEKGGKLVQETRRWDALANVSQSMRSKENAHDYRYFPDPDLLPVRVDKSVLEALRKELVEQPFDRQRRYMKDYDLSYPITSVMCLDLPMCKFFEEAIAAGGNPKALANLLVNEISCKLSESANSGEGRLCISALAIKPSDLASLVKLTEGGKISKAQGREVLSEMFESGKTPEQIVEEKGLAQNSDSGELEKLCADAIAANPVAVAEFKAGNTKAVNALIGPIMKASKGKANPAMLIGIITKLIS